PAYYREIEALGSPTPGIAAAAAPPAHATSAEARTLSLAPATPNPFTERTTLRASLPEAGPVLLAVYDVLGRRVATLIDAPMAAGRHEARFDASDLPTGPYLVRLHAAGRTL